MTSHTPGPWRANGSLIVGPQMALQVASAYPVKIGNAPRTDAEQRANAQLIASAPNLLQALLLAQATIRRLDRNHSAEGTLDVIAIALKESGN